MCSFSIQHLALNISHERGLTVKEKELVEYIAKSLVEKPEAVAVKEIRGSNVTVLELHVAREDMGRVIGKDGRVANALRTLLRVATRDEKRVVLEIV